MTNAKCRSCDRAAAGACCSPCAADIMTKALNPFFGGGERGSPGLSRPVPPLPPLNTGSSSNPVRTILCADSFQQILGRQARLDLVPEHEH